MRDEQGKTQEESLRVFSEAASTYDRIGPRYFSHFGQRLVDLAQIVPGTKVLDVAAGRGAVLFPASTRVGSRGHVIGIDFSTDMVRETTAEIEGEGWQHAQIRQMDAEQLDFPDASFDWVLCGFALWMFSQPHRVLQGFHRVLKPGGRVGLSTWAADNPFQNWCHDVLRPYVPSPAPQAAATNETPKFNTPAHLEAALQQAGFAHLQINIEDGDFVYANEEELWLSLWTGGIRRRLEKMTPPVLNQAKADVCQKLQALKRPDGIHLVWRVLFAFGTKPAQ